MADSSSTKSRVRRVLAEPDVVIILLFFAGMLLVADDYHPVAREFPVLFLSIGLVAMVLELLVLVLPERYSRPIQRLTTGLAAEMSDVDDEEGDEYGVDYSTLGLALGVIIGFGVLAYFISFLLAVPLFVFGSIYLLGSRNPVYAAITTVVLLVAIYGLFGEIMNVPVGRGEFVDVDRLLRTILLIRGL